MANSKRKPVGAGVIGLMGGGAQASFRTEPGNPKTLKPTSPVSREIGKPAVRKLTVDVPASVHDEYEDLYLDLRRKHRKLKRIQYAPLVLRHGLDRGKIEAELEGPGNPA